MSRSAKPWAPEKCPITQRPFFMWIEHHKTGDMVPTYGGPYDSYTLAEFDGEDFVCERFDHDAGGWLVDCVEGLGVKLVDDQSLVIDPNNTRYEEIEAFAAAPVSAEPVYQFRKEGCANWHDGHPDHSDGGGPYEVRTLYTAPVAAQAQLESAELREARHDSAHAETESERVRALAYWLEQQTYEPDMLSNAADTLRAYLEEKNQAQPLPDSLIPTAPDLEYLRSMADSTNLPAFLRGQIAAAVKALAGAQAQPEDDSIALDRLADYIADTWPMDKKYGLEEICQRLHAMWPGEFIPVDVLAHNDVNVREALRALLLYWDRFQKSDGNQHDAYNLLVKAAHHAWQFARTEIELVAAPCAQAQQDGDMVSCGCGDIYPSNSYGAGFIAAAGHCENCDAAQDHELLGPGADAVRALLAERDVLRDALAGVLVDDLLPLLPAEYIAKVRAALAQNMDAEPAP